MFCELQGVCCSGDLLSLDVKVVKFFVYETLTFLQKNFFFNPRTSILKYLIVFKLENLFKRYPICQEILLHLGFRNFLEIPCVMY